jgi:hypothetical protein
MMLDQRWPNAIAVSPPDGVALGDVCAHLTSAFPPEEDSLSNLQSSVRILVEDDVVVVQYRDGLDPDAVVQAVADAIAIPAAAADPLVSASVAVQTAVAAAMATVAITSPTLTKAQKASIEDQVTAQVQQVVGASLGTA